MFCCMLLYVYSSIAIILMGKRELVAMPNLSSWCLVMVERLFLAVPRGCLRFVLFPDHTHLLFLKSQDRDQKYVGYKRSPIEIVLTSKSNVTIRHKSSQSLLTKSQRLCSQEDEIFAKRVNQGKKYSIPRYLRLDGPCFFSLILDLYVNYILYVSYF